MYLTEILPRAAAAYPNKVAVVCGQIKLNYREVADRVGRLAYTLTGLGVGPGERIALLHSNCHRSLEAYFAAAHAGAVLVPLNCRLTARDLAYIIDDTESRVLFADATWGKLATEAATQAHTRCTLVWSPSGDENRRGPSSLDYETSLLTAGSHPLGEPRVKEDDPANIYYTSGTTGHQKGVVLTHRNIYSHALATIADLRLSDSDIWAHVAPMFHLADAWATWAMTWVGARHVMLGRFDAKLVLQTLVEQGVTVTNLIPTMLNDLINTPQAICSKYPSLRLLMTGGAPIAPKLVRRVVETFGCEYVQTYGLTETSPYLTFSLLKENLRNLPPDEQMRYRSMTGRAALGVTLRVVDDAGRDIPADGQAVGEIVARGDRITPGYWRLQEVTAEAFRDGWFHTGDLATIDEEGYINIVDRKKDIILTGGEIVYSTEIENALYEHPAVLEAAVVGVPDERWGETIRAVVVVKPGWSMTVDDITVHCQERLARYKCPRSVKFVKALPRTGSGKISKREIRQRY
ncbi:MAG: long-chain-fatty-acid--CoA ligase [Candidatus Binatia bacterium]